MSKGTFDDSKTELKDLHNGGSTIASVWLAPHREIFELRVRFRNDGREAMRLRLGPQTILPSFFDEAGLPIPVPKFAYFEPFAGAEDQNMLLYSFFIVESHDNEEVLHAFTDTEVSLDPGSSCEIAIRLGPAIRNAFLEHLASGKKNGMKIGIKILFVVRSDKEGEVPAYYYSKEPLNFELFENELRNH